ncbi:MAG: cyclic pyranopterin monophosphate synthase [Thermoanaerobacteraceae bacterium]|jgi:cyclic pyranopterin phosphate synthase|uniref:Cyclic pyranopterin monophosphate synthase n=1 Tax=Biomaibacter acetigenes TaxID=2316383 RepID=A0A3G2R981_9FIRM|nr:cyclic pyranopterin monophosphate synthase MoaC [Biomaibacter acetigenes]MDK2879093.1 cyclic pyranopterin monophosphate synthase [Thermoanaerobacteraceae bacterium]RKL62092.1 cyclic pyranopterin monophosphate synthase MoaC [Thermoanaerobacteraceae bacterium SP2]AYO31578.1 cyclic pyranopterin monophosphate synthase MoaC [Biomaibacter acetigenes]MDN5302437.1 cyclic pyranopterin monophosphate synthase [Thermoanaerobacteraceae bacterium]MDN5312606.1 cyclic pyranopterin monophosphate synthase [T
MEFTHFDEEGRARMVNVGEKPDTERVAVARGFIEMKPETLKMIVEGRAKKGDVLAVSQVAGIMAAKETSRIIPMCHNIFLTGVDVKFQIYEDKSAIGVEARVTTVGKTGVEMEALTAVSVACLTIYDMCKAVDRGMVIKDICLMEKSGGKSGEYIRNENVFVKY